MNQVNYAAMSNQELKRYFIEHRDDETALQAYLNRRKQRSLRIITRVGNSDFDQKIQAAIQQKLQQAES